MWCHYDKASIIIVSLQDIMYTGYNVYVLGLFSLCNSFVSLANDEISHWALIKTLMVLLLIEISWSEY
jgi:hypothetical protein